jgi:hypothetical protein
MVFFLNKYREVTMDYQEFELHVADYVEGTLDSEQHQRMSAARAADSACDTLATVHEQLLAAFEETPQVSAPVGFADKIMAEARLREELAAAEQKAFRRGIWLGVVAAAVMATSLAVVLWTIDFSTGAGTLEAVRSAGNNWLTSASTVLYGWLEDARVAMNHSVTLPIVGHAVPLYMVVLSAMASAVLAFFRDEILATVDSF